MGDHRLRGRSESPGRPGKVLPSSPGPAGVVHDRNPGAHGRAGSSLSGTLAHSQRYNGSQRSQITRLRRPMSWLGRNVTVGAFRSGGGWCCGRCCDVVGPRVAALGGFANPPFLACSSLSGCCPIAFVGDDSVGDPCLLRHVLGPPSSRIFCRARVSPRRRAASTEGWRKGAPRGSRRRAWRHLWPRPMGGDWVRRGWISSIRAWVLSLGFGPVPSSCGRSDQPSRRSSPGPDLPPGGS